MLVGGLDSDKQSGTRERIGRVLDQTMEIPLLNRCVLGRVSTALQFPSGVQFPPNLLLTKRVRPVFTMLTIQVLSAK